MPRKEEQVDRKRVDVYHHKDKSNRVDGRTVATATGTGCLAGGCLGSMLGGIVFASLVVSLFVL